MDKSINPFPLPEPMCLALLEARKAGEQGEVPVGAVVTLYGKIITSAANAMQPPFTDPTGHAEIRALRQAAAILGNSRLEQCDLWVTLEPCAMCAGAISIARIRRLYFGADDPKGGAVLYGPRLFFQPTSHHRPEIYNDLGGREAAELLRHFFQKKRQKKSVSS
ncbi:MAG: nucleoside deaminase [Zymomonas mobilis subsp. pomaceae]|uniref:tRNA-specific adenosine deaminase n=1 Tax=Zymomonas mobilis subsp. pomaceae (strain ATCC 29192 / DSM 22645 / JCM 10191 / CCUG 17912 / NBRC 13757 / NCIMB 11200 / NRRL B-4491 / Barker I) TaxID=579138 RepID=F8ESL5_ZYMMT|nr:nucleoside deaminase [Zymomonas mobilis]AEI37790.1 CMP/dCMP deaminase zinc-binding protein [Zymomonas mobilis subsp. pomaceae ATCC 29192]MDX5949157.1 nucleoside deaminase [Zymomonas mobilis subsp. pomaceae]GEB89793.1 tRNA-specific adenosine deaminase [Zymomonas mobilis subsp. pomaceae]